MLCNGGYPIEERAEELGQLEYYNQIKNKYPYDWLEDLMEYKQRIDKAIEYLEHNGYGYDCTGEIYYSLDEDEQQDLLEILKGDTNDKTNKENN